MPDRSRRPRRNVVLTIDPDEWDRLCEQARAEKRDPFAQAYWLLVRGLDAGADAAAAAEGSAPATADVA